MLQNGEFALSHWGSVPGEEVGGERMDTRIYFVPNHSSVEGMFLCHSFTVTRYSAEEDVTVCKILPRQNFSFPCS